MSRPDGLDWLTFTLDEHPAHPRIGGPGVIYEGVRLRVQAHLAGEPYGATFGLDLGVGAPLIGAVEYRRGPNLLDLVDQAPVDIPVYPLATHVADKVHACTVPRHRTQHAHEGPDRSRAGRIGAHGRCGALRAALDATFTFRATHPRPTVLPPAPAEWTARYPREREIHSLGWSSIEEVHGEAVRRMGPVLERRVEGGMWAPAERVWRGDEVEARDAT